MLIIDISLVNDGIPCSEIECLNLLLLAAGSKSGAPANVIPLGVGMASLKMEINVSNRFLEKQTKTSYLDAGFLHDLVVLLGHLGKGERACIEPGVLRTQFCGFKSFGENRNRDRLLLGIVGTRLASRNVRPLKSARPESSKS